jgi:SAM-dependent methyltransferase
MGGDHLYLDKTRDVALLHYHCNLNSVGLIKEVDDSPAVCREAIKLANKQIGRGFDNRVFWDFRYNRFPELGSGVGSRGEILEYKRVILANEGIEEAASILDVGCGDLEVLKVFRLKQYVGLDISPAALTQARHARPDLTF